MTEIKTERQLRYYTSRLYTDNILTETQVAGLESIARDNGGQLEWATIWAVLMNITSRYTELERDLQNAAGLADQELQVTT